MSYTYQQIIPTAYLPGVEAALQSTFQKAAVEHLELLSGGLSGSKVYKIIVDDHPYLLKLDARSALKVEGLSVVLNQTSEAGIAPRLYYYNQEDGVSITGFVAAQPLQASMTQDHIIEGLGKNLRVLHRLPCCAKGKDLWETIDGFIAAFQQSKVLTGAIINDTLAAYAKIKQAYSCKESDMVLSHNDLNPGNILCDGMRLWFIDWDAASLNDRFVDLAAVANFFVHTEDQEMRLLRTYFDGEPTPEQSSRFFLMRQVSRLIYGMLLGQLAGQAKPAGYIHDQKMDDCTLRRFGELIRSGQISMQTYEGQLFYAKANFNAAFNNIWSGRFEESLSLIDT